MASNNVQLLYGGALFTSTAGVDTPEKAEGLLNTIAELGISTIDTAYIYEDSEEILGKAKAASRFTIDTKFPGGFVPNTSSKEQVVNYARESLKRLGTNSVNVYYQHAPEPNHSLEDTLAGVNELYQSGAFKKFGLSNFSAEDIEETIRISKEKGWVLPSVYQGNYSAFARHTENYILPTLRKHNIAFYGYSVSAGGFLAKKSETLRAAKGVGRWDPNNQYGQLYGSLYAKESLLDGLDEWNGVAASEGVSGIELAYRWIVYSSKLDGALGDGVILGGRESQVKELAGWIKKGPLSEAAIKKIEDIWVKIEKDAPLDNYHSNNGWQKKD